MENSVKLNAFNGLKNVHATATNMVVMICHRFKLYIVSLVLQHSAINAPINQLKTNPNGHPCKNSGTAPYRSQQYSSVLLVQISNKNANAIIGNQPNFFIDLIKGMY